MYIGPVFLLRYKRVFDIYFLRFNSRHCEKKPKKSLAERRVFNHPMRFIVAGNDHKGTGNFADIYHHGQGIARLYRAL